MFSRSRPSYEAMKCPVCPATFGERDKASIFKAHCRECKATFYWKPWADKPSVVMDSQKKHIGYCGPDGCVCR